MSRCQCEIIKNIQGFYIKDWNSNRTKLLKISWGERISIGEFMKHFWLKVSQVIGQATQLNDKKMLTWR